MFNESDGTYHYSNSSSGDTPGNNPQSQPPHFPWDYEQPHHSAPAGGPTSPKKKKQGWTAGKVIALALICSLLSGV